MLQNLKNQDNLQLLWHYLEQVIKETEGEKALKTAENIKDLCQNLRNFKKDENKKRIEPLFELSEEELVPTVRLFNQFLNLANIVEQHNEVSRTNEHLGKASLEKLFIRLKNAGFNQTQILEKISALFIELVLTAHPTEVTRRSFITKHIEINRCLNKLGHQDLTDCEKRKINNRLKELIALMWHTSEIRFKRPTPIEEAKAGIVVLENSLWQALPTFLRTLDELLLEHFDCELPIEPTLVKFSSWMGGDRDGNPLVTYQTTEKVLLMNRLKIAQLLLTDMQYLVDELSVKRATTGFCEKYQLGKEPYRDLFKRLREKLAITAAYYNDLLENRKTLIAKQDIILQKDEILTPLIDAYQSLCDCKMKTIAKGALLDTIYRVKSFGLILMKIDIRQESSRHSEFLSQITTELNLGDYLTFSEEQRQAFLLQELRSNRPLLPRDCKLSDDNLELLNTAKIIATNEDAIASYVISMAKAPSDVLAVLLILKEAGAVKIPPIVPLFETLEDLKNAKSVMRVLFEIPMYRDLINNKQMVMIGYSDSAKDAGMLAASWQQYLAQEDLVSLANEKGITLTLFHGRGGTIGRGGAPAHAALLSQPPRSLENGLRVTEQGEMIRFKLGLPEIAVETLSLYASAILEANIFPPPKPTQKWREMMDRASEISCQKYREIVRETKDFVPYFRAATPEQELTKLPLGSRPAKRNPQGGVESLRAIPWIFAWTQNRLMLPTWLGAGDGLTEIFKEREQEILKMCRDWPFFSTRIGMLEMVFSKVDLWLSSLYDEILVPKEYHTLGKNLRQKLRDDMQTLMKISHKDHFMGDLPIIAESIKYRNLYTDPLNLLQIVLLSKLRNSDQTSEILDHALMISIAGIAAGMRNTG